MLAAQMRDEALVCQTWLRTTLNAFDGTTVAITHFAPSLNKSADPRYGMTPGAAGFCNALDEAAAAGPTVAARACACAQ